MYCHIDFSCFLLLSNYYFYTLLLHTGIHKNIALCKTVKVSHFELKLLVVYRSSETSINQSGVIIRSDDRFLNLVVDSDSIVSKIYMLNFVLWLFFFSVSILTKILQFYPSWVFFALILTNIWQFCPSVLLTLSQYTYLD